MTSRLRIDHAARIVLHGGVIAYPTEAVYGIGCLPEDAYALERVLAIKQRDASKGLIVIAASIDQLESLAEFPAGDRGREIRASWPGPVTWIVRARAGLPHALTGSRPTVAVRVTRHPIARRLCERAGSAIVSTSANLSGRRPARTALAVRRQLGDSIDWVLAGPLGDSAKPTEIRDAATGRILRRG